MPPCRPVIIIIKRDAALVAPFPEFIAEFGNESWELDALDPRYLEKLVRTHIEELTDADLLSAEVADQTMYRSELREIAENLE